MHSDHSSQESIVNKPDQHGFVVTGLETVFLDHLAMFYMADHRYQVILRVSLPAYAMNRYVADRQAHPNEVYILGNSQYDLMTLPQIQTGELTAFTADLFRGLPEDPNTTPPLIHNVKVNIDRVVYFRPFDFLMDYPKYLTYVLYGAGTEAHLSHRMTKEPDFQQVVDLAELPKWLPPLQLESGCEINFPKLPYPGKTYCQSPFTVPEYEVMYQGQQPQLYNVRIGKSFYFDTASLNKVNPCKA
ncbi:MAG TPA: hypothetical protein VGR07_15110 [Thermoanaerobaculia bacterium]|nr:hypothetical protein [Thermoanaerobaculia bacterium]